MEVDPAGLVARIPELAPIAQRHDRVRSAIEIGAPISVYDELVRLSWFSFRADRAERAIIRKLLDRRREFTETTSSLPRLFSLNGCGVTLYGNAEAAASDGTYLKTLFIILVWIPCYPLGSYLVRDVPSGDRAFRVFAKAPLARSARVYRLLVRLYAAAWCLFFIAIVGLMILGASG